MKPIFLAAFTFLFTGCSDQQSSDGGVANEPRSHYEIEGFYVFPLKELQIGQSREEIRGSLGEPTEVNTKSFKEPNRVKLSSMPKFDEQWGISKEWATTGYSSTTDDWLPHFERNPTSESTQRRTSAWRATADPPRVER